MGQSSRLKLLEAW